MPIIATTLPIAPSPGKKPERKATPHKTRLRAILTGLLLLVWLCSSAQAGGRIDVADEGNWQYQTFSILEDPDQRLGWQDFQDPRYGQFFRQVKGRHAYLEKETSRYWLHFQFANTQAHTAVRILKLSPTTLKNPRLYCAGHQIPELVIPSNFQRPQILFELSMLPEQILNCYASVDNNLDIQLRVELLESADVLHSTGKQHFYDATLFGATALFLLFNLAAGLAYRDKLFYCLAIYCTVQTLIPALGMGYFGPVRGILPPWPDISMTALTMLLLSLEQLFALGFPIYPKDRAKLWRPLLSAAIGCNILALAISIISSGQYSTLINTSMIAANGILLLSCAFHCYMTHFSRLVLTYLLTRVAVAIATTVTIMAYYFRVADEDQAYLFLSICMISTTLCYTMLLVSRSNNRVQKYNDEQRRIAIIGEVSRAKTEALARLTHDIRTPLSAMLGVTEMLAESRLTSDQRDYIQTLQRSSHELLQTLQESGQALQFSDREAELNQEIILLADLVGDSMSSFRNMAAERRLELIIDLDPELPSRVLGDPSRLKQLLTHAMNSAFEHSTEGHILFRIHASLTRRNYLSFEFNHTGSPFSHRERQASEDTESNSQSGIINTRFAIMGQLLSLMGGNLSLHNGGNRSHTLSFSIPFQVPDRARFSDDTNSSLQDKTSTDNSLLESRRLLVVDENKTFCEVIEKQCKKWGMDVFSASNEAAAIALIRNQRLLERPIDIALIDQKLPGNGLQLARQLSRDGNENQRAPICILMAFANIQLGRDELTSAQVNRVLSKPINSVALRSALLGELHYDASRPSQRPSEFHTSSLQPQAINCLVAEDNLTNAIVVQRMLETMGATVTLVENGQQAVNKFFREKFDVVILDIEMPVMDGIEACEQIRSFEEEEGRFRTPIFGLTANALDEQRDTYLQAGMDLHLIKPIRLWELAEALKRWTGFDNQQNGEQHPDDEDAV